MSSCINEIQHGLLFLFCWALVFLLVKSGTWSCIRGMSKPLTIFLNHKRLTGDSSVLSATTWYPPPQRITHQVRGHNLTSNTETIRKKKGNLKASERLELTIGLSHFLQGGGDRKSLNGTYTFTRILTVPKESSLWEVEAGFLQEALRSVALAYSFTFYWVSDFCELDSDLIYSLMTDTFSSLHFSQLELPHTTQSSLSLTLLDWFQISPFPSIHVLSDMHT